MEKYILVLLMVVVIFVFMLNGLTLEYVDTIEVNCVDANSNKIINQTCEKDIYCGVISFMNVKECKEVLG